MNHLLTSWCFVLLWQGVCPGYPETLYVDQVGLKLRDCCLCLSSADIKRVHHHSCFLLASLRNVPELSLKTLLHKTPFSAVWASPFIWEQAGSLCQEIYHMTQFASSRQGIIVGSFRCLNSWRRGKARRSKERTKPNKSQSPLPIQPRKTQK